MDYNLFILIKLESRQRYNTSLNILFHLTQYAITITKILITAMKMAYDMQEIQKATCSSCGTSFVAENATATLCPSCAGNQEHHSTGCGCGH
jgi:predicted RNA-binding Zn-ribbon protein involved in translation (DUF1610 family)